MTTPSDMIISESMIVKGDLRFEKMLRVNGTVEGHIYAPPEVYSYLIEILCTFTWN